MAALLRDAMNRLAPESRVQFLPFTRQADGLEVVVGRLETSTFLALPLEAFEVMELLAAGKTLREAQEIFAAQHGEIPDVEFLVEVLAGKGFVAHAGDEDPQALPGVSSPRQTVQRFHFTGIPQSVAQAIFSRPALILSAVIVALALATAASHPGLIPGWRALFFRRNMTLMTLSLMAIGLFTTFLHEMAHLVAARAKGVLSRLSISSRMWVLVAETDMTGVWSLPRRDRFLPLLAGPLFDLVLGSLLFLILFASQQGWISVPLLLGRLLAALVLGCFMRLLWQCFFFVRTDFYFVYATFFGCKNLMKDTRDYLKNRLLELKGKAPGTDQAHIPPHEMRAIRIYSLFWILGRALAYLSLLVITLPLTWNYLRYLGSNLLHFRTLDRHLAIDSMLIVVIQLSFTLTGLGLWLKSFRPTRRPQ